MDEKPTAILKAEEVKETPVQAETAMPTASETWSKFPPQIDNDSQVSEPKSSKGLLIVVIVLILLAVGVVGFVVYKSNSMSKSQIVSEITPTPAEVAEVPTATPVPSITDKSVVKIQVLNGSGEVGQAGKIATALEKDDFKTPETGNFEGDNQSDTIVNYTSAVDPSLIEDVVTVLEETFTTVNASVSSTLTDFDIQIITGTDE